MRNLTATESLDKVLQLCDAQLRSSYAPRQLIEGLKKYKTEILVNRATIGDEETAKWLDWNVKVIQLIYMYGKRKDF